jgi:CubicO group peptidase (beta-lactamase class C family)
MILQNAPGYTIRMSFPDATPRAIAGEAETARVFPGAVVWLSRGDAVAAHFASGNTAYDAEYSAPVQRDTLYDLASVSKPFTMTAWLIAAREHGIAAEMPLARFLPVFESTPLQDITLRDLLRHSSGLRFAVQELAKTPVAEWNARIAAAPPGNAAGDKVYYSCTNYYLLARVLEIVCGSTLREFIEERILAPLGLAHTTFEPLREYSLQQLAPTEIDATTGQPWHGIAHDPAARSWREQTGGACGNAGLFSTAADLARFSRMWLEDGAPLLREDDARRAFTDALPENQNLRGWCWQIDALGFMSHLRPPQTAGHMGFTGPTLFLNPHTKHLAIVLNNRVYPTRDGPNRLSYHRRLAAWLFETTGVE